MTTVIWTQELLSEWATACLAAILNIFQINIAQEAVLYMDFSKAVLKCSNINSMQIVANE